MTTILPALEGWLLTATIHGSVAILLAAVLVPVFRRSFGAASALWLWAAVLLRLLIPGLPAGPFVVPSHALAIAPSSAAAPGLAVTARVDAPPATKIPSPSATTRATPVAPGVPWLAILWAGGCGGFLGLSVLRSAQARRIVRRARDITTDPALREACPGLPAGITVRETDVFASPALSGLWHPTILLPVGWRERFTPEEVACMLRHEVGHWRRGDLVWRWAFLGARAVHWFNPLVWWAERRFQLDQELACDEWALTRRGAPLPLAYGDALLRAAQKTLSISGPVIPVQAGMAASRRDLQRRLRHIAEVRGRSRLAALAPLAAGAALLVITGPLRSAAPAQPAAPSASPSLTSSPAAPPKSPGIVTDAQVRIETRVVSLPARMADSLLRGNSAGSPDVLATYSAEQVRELMRRLPAAAGVDFLSAPTITTRNGGRSTVEIVREVRYPSRYNFEDGQLVPADFVTRNVGVEIGITPTLTDAGTILLEILPRITDFEGFIDYGSAPPVGKGDDALARAMTVPRDATAASQPVFSSRSASLAVTLRDGETALVAGLGGRWENRGDREETVLCFVTASKVVPPLPRSIPSVR